MAEKINAPMPRELDLGGGWQVVWAAVDPSTGAAVSGVVISNANVVAEDLTGGLGLPAADTPILLGVAATA